MAGSRIDAWTDVACPVVGMLHAPALPGSPRFAGDVAAVHRRVLDDVEALVAGGVHGLMLENFGDVPFFADRVPPSVVAQMTALAAEVRRIADLPLGINVLRNDALAALSIAHAVGAAFIRVNVLCGARVTDQGLIEGRAAELLRLRREIGADHVCIFADVEVKHSAPLGKRPIEDDVSDTIRRGLADTIIVSGAGTGRTVNGEELRRVRGVAGDAPVWIGSGVSVENVEQYRGLADGLIVGSSLKRGGDVHAPVDAKRVEVLVSKL